MYSHFCNYCEATGSTILEFIQKIGEVVTPEDVREHIAVKRSFKNELQDSLVNYPLGQLSTKAEPAGKLRVFAIVDS
jgi:ribose 5-phosphate isomerase